MAFRRLRNPDRFARKPSAHLMPCIDHRFGSLEHARIGDQAQECQQADPGQADARRAVELLVEPVTRRFVLCDGIAIGIYQGLYIEKLARDHLQHMVTGHVDEYLKDGTPKRIKIEASEFGYVRALAERWMAISQPHFHERKWWKFWR